MLIAWACDSPGQGPLLRLGFLLKLSIGGVWFLLKLATGGFRVGASAQPLDFKSYGLHRGGSAGLS